MSGASISRATRARATKWYGAKCGSSNRHGIRWIASIVPKERLDRTGFFEGSMSDPCRAGERRIKWIWSSPSKSATPAACNSAWATRRRKISLSASVAQANIFGSGNQLSFRINSGTISKVYELSYLNPYWTVDGISRGFDLYRRDLNTASLSTGEYKSVSTDWVRDSACQ